MNKFEILDGAMGSELIRRGIVLPKHIWSAQANIEAQEIIYTIHKEYKEAGASYLTTNTFRSTPRSYQKIGLNHEDAIRTAKISLKNAVFQAKRVSSDKCKVLGSIAPLEDCYSPNLFPGENVAKDEFIQIGKWFQESKVDILLLETMNSIIETKICLDSISTHNLPVWVSFVLRDDKHILSGDKLTDAIKLLSDYNVDTLLINCNPLNRTESALSIISNTWNKRWGIYPNLGLGEPSPDGNIKEIHSDEEFLYTCNHAINLGASIIGGCCGSSPKHISLLRDRVIK